MKLLQVCHHVLHDCNPRRPVAESNGLWQHRSVFPPPKQTCVAAFIAWAPDTLHFAEFLLLLLWLMLFFASLVTYSFLLATFFSRAKLSAIVAPIALFATILPRYIFFTAEDDEAVSWKILAALLSPTCFTFAADQMSRFEGEPTFKGSWISIFCQLHANCVNELTVISLLQEPNLESASIQCSKMKGSISECVLCYSRSIRCSIGCSLGIWTKFCLQCTARRGSGTFAFSQVSGLAIKAAQVSHCLIHMSLTALYFSDTCLTLSRPISYTCLSLPHIYLTLSLTYVPLTALYLSHTASHCLLYTCLSNCLHTVFRGRHTYCFHVPDTLSHTSFSGRHGRKSEWRTRAG